MVVKTINNYDTKGKKIQSIDYHKKNGEWVRGKSIKYEYNVRGLVEKKIDSTYNLNITTYTYQDTLLIEEKRFLGKDTSDITISWTKKYQYNNSLLMRESMYDRNNQEYFRQEYIYDSRGNKVEISISEWNEGKFDVTVREMYLYDENNLLINEKTFINDEISSQKTYEYDNKHFLVQKVDYLKVDGILQPGSKITYENNPQGQSIRELLYSNIDFKGQFILGSKLTRTYDYMGNLTSTTHMALFEGVWYPLPDSDERWIYYFVPVK